MKTPNLSRAKKTFWPEPISREIEAPCFLSRRELLLLGAASACPTLAFATIPPPPSSPWYLIFIADGIYKISNLYVVDLPPAAGTCQNYTAAIVSQRFGANFTYTQRTGVSAWQMLLNAPSYRWWEYYDKRNGRYVRLYQGDRIEARFADKSRVKVIFRGEGAFLRFEPLVGTERLPDGTRLYPRERDRDGGQDKGRDGSDGGITRIRPTAFHFSWSYSTQDTPW